jgi:hypothetical protein
VRSLAAANRHAKRACGPAHTRAGVRASRSAVHRESRRWAVALAAHGRMAGFGDLLRGSRIGCGGCGVHISLR